MITKKDMEALAANLKRARNISEPKSWGYAVAFVMLTCVQANPNFKRDKPGKSPMQQAGMPGASPLMANTQNGASGESQ